MPIEKQNDILSFFNDFIKKNTSLNDFNGYEEDSMWMSYRYCIGRHTIASHMRAGDIGTHCYGRMTRERSIFTAYDINREIEERLQFGNCPEWHFPITSMNRIYTSAIDIFCQFIEDYDIKSKEDYLKYYKIDVILADNERGYKIETTTWEEKLESLVPLFAEIYGEDGNDYDVKSIIEWIKKKKQTCIDDVDSRIRWIIRSYPNPEYFYLNDIEDLFVWNNLVHLFDLEHHHKSVLTNGEEVEWYWTYTNDSEQREDGFWYRKEVGYKKIRVPVDAKIGSVTRWIPEETIREFMLDLFETPFYISRDIRVRYSKYNSEWYIDNKNRARNNIKVFKTYGTDRINAYKILETTLNLKDVKIFDTVVDSEGKKTRVLNKKETAIAQAKQEQIKQAFEDWVWKDQERRENHPEE